MRSKDKVWLSCHFRRSDDFIPKKHSSPTRHQQIYVVLRMCKNRPSIEKVVTTHSEAYRIAFEGQYKWIKNYFFKTGCCEEKPLRPRRSNHVWTEKDLDTLKALYKEEIRDIQENEYELLQTFTVHPYTLQL